MLKNKYLIAYYPFENNSNDCSGNNNTTLSDNIIYNDQGFGKLAIFNKINTAINIPSNPLINLIESFYLRLCFTSNDYDNTLCIVKRSGDKNEFLNAEFSFFWNSPQNEFGEFITIDFSGVRQNLSVNLRQNINQYFDVYCGFSAKKQLIIINNQIIINQTGSYIKKINNYPIIIGYNHPNNNVKTGAKIDNLIFFSKILSMGDIKRLRHNLHPLS